MSMDAAVESLGWTPVKGAAWLQEQSVELDEQGVAGDRLWSPVVGDIGGGLRCIKATDVPWLVGVGVLPAELADEPQLSPATTQVRYYHRHFEATIHRGRVAERLSRAAGQELWLARTSQRPGFIWSSPVSVLLRSELDDLPTDTGRYRPNLVLDDRAAPLRLSPGSRLRVQGVELEVEQPLERCLVINHNPVTGQQDHSLLKRLHPGVLLAWGCRVVRPGTLRVDG